MRGRALRHAPPVHDAVQPQGLMPRTNINRGLLNSVWFSRLRGSVGPRQAWPADAACQLFTAPSSCLREALRIRAHSGLRSINHS